jgi:hypothetical protein
MTALIDSHSLSFSLSRARAHADVRFVRSTWMHARIEAAVIEGTRASHIEALDFLHSSLAGRGAAVGSPSALGSCARRPQDGNTKRSSVDGVCALSITMGATCVWCASGMITFGCAHLIPSSISPWLLDLPSSSLITSASLAVLLAAAPIAHVLSCVVVDAYRLWQPFSGGKRFVHAQAAGWALWTVGALLPVALDASAELNAPVASFDISDAGGFRWERQAPPSASCFSCSPQALITIALLSLGGNASLLASLHLFDPRRTALAPR